LLTQRQRSNKLQRYRAEQSLIALERDDYTCRRCGAEGSPPHHCYGHGNWNTREQYEHSSKLLTLCISCHSRCHWALPPISKAEVIDILERVLEDET